MAREILLQTLRVFFMNRRRIVIWDAPLLFEQGLHHICQSTLLIYVPHDTEVKRLCERDKIDAETAEKKVSTFTDNSHSSLSQHMRGFVI
jgi:dephospho-CoA kinase